MTLQAEHSTSAAAAAEPPVCSPPSALGGSGPQLMDEDGAGGQGGAEVRGMARLSIAADEQSYVCARCGCVISVRRRHAHDTAWCQAAAGHGGGSGVG